MHHLQSLRNLREDRDLTQGDIAKISNTSQSYYAQFENTKQKLPFARAIELVKFYNASLDYLAGIVDTIKPLKGCN